MINPLDTQLVHDKALHFGCDSLPWDIKEVSKKQGNPLHECPGTLVPLKKFPGVLMIADCQATTR